MAQKKVHETTSCTSVGLSVSSVGLSVGLFQAMFLYSRFVCLHKSKDTLLCPVLSPFVNRKIHVGVVPECIRNQSLPTVKLTFELAHIIGIIEAIAANAENESHGTVTPEERAHLLHTAV